jgi:hypothetical protein
VADQHEILQDLKRVAADLGRAPNRDEYHRGGLGKFTEHQLKKVYGAFSVALQAAGLAVEAKAKPDKVSAKELFGKCLEEQLEAHEAKRGPTLKPVEFTDTVVVGDLHFPFVHTPTLEQLYAYLETFKHEVKRVVQVGDLFDFFSFGKFPRSHNLYTPKQEVEMGHAMAVAFWKRVREIIPGVECFQILGNHDIRPIKRLIESRPELELFFCIDPFFQFEGVTTVLDSRQELVLDEVVYHHGYRSGLGDHRDFNLMNSVVGHTHLGGVTYRQIRGRVLFELNAGYMGDPESKALSYTSQKLSKWTRGWGRIDKWGPRFIPAL